MGNKISLQRVFTANPEKVYKAFIDADALASWMPPNGFVGKIHSMSVAVGGTFHMSFTNFGTGKSQSFGGICRFLESKINPVVPQLIGTLKRPPGS